MHEPRGPPLEVVNDNLTRHKLDVKRTTTSQRRKKRGGAEAAARFLRLGPAHRPTLSCERRGMDDRREPPPVPRPGPGTRGANGARGSRKKFQNSNDPSAGSPTETLLRLLLSVLHLADTAQ